MSELDKQTRIKPVKIESNSNDIYNIQKPPIFILPFNIPGLNMTQSSICVGLITLGLMLGMAISFLMFMFGYSIGISSFVGAVFIISGILVSNSVLKSYRRKNGTAKRS